MSDIWLIVVFLTKDAVDKNSEPVTGQLHEAPLKTYYFGCGPFHPQWLQTLANKKVFTLFLCLFVAIQGSVVSGIITEIGTVFS